jgi:hypothetical protein
LLQKRDIVEGVEPGIIWASLGYDPAFFLQTPQGIGRHPDKASGLAYRKQIFISSHWAGYAKISFE